MAKDYRWQLYKEGLLSPTDPGPIHDGTMPREDFGNFSLEKRHDVRRGMMPLFRALIWGVAMAACTEGAIGQKKHPAGLPGVCENNGGKPAAFGIRKENKGCEEVRPPLR